MDNSNLIFHILIGFGALQSLFIASIFFTSSKGHLPKRLFAIFLTIEGITLVERLLVETDLIQLFPHILGISHPFNFLKSPLFLILAWAIVDSKFKIKKVHFLHFIPFVLMLLLNIPFYLMSATQKIEMVKIFVNYVPAYTDFEFYVSLSFFAYIGIYLSLTLIALNRYIRQIKNNQLANWTYKVLVLYTLGTGIMLIYYIILPSGQLEIPLFNLISMLIMSFLMQSIAYSFFSQAHVFNKKTSSPTVPIQQRKTDEELIRERIETDQAYLNDQLTLDEFAETLNLPKKYVSAIINQQFGCNFKYLINQYRVEEAKRIMQEEIESTIHLIDIAHESGFNNKVSFYRVFKNHTGKSPSDYFETLKSNHSK